MNKEDVMRWLKGLLPRKYQGINALIKCIGAFLAENFMMDRVERENVNEYFNRPAWVYPKVSEVVPCDTAQHTLLLGTF